VDSSTWQLPLPGQPIYLPPGPLHRLCAGLAALRPLAALPGDPPTPGDWCYGASLWGNPLLPPAVTVAATTIAASEWGVPLYTVADALYYSAWHPPRLAVTSPSQQHWSDSLTTTSILLRMDCLRLLQALPPGWLDAASAVHRRLRDQPDTSPQVVVAPAYAAAVLPHLGWRRALRFGDATASNIPIQRLTVATATQLQLGPMLQLRSERFASFATEALGREVHGVALRALLGTFRRMWRLPVLNTFKEPFWRLAINGWPGHQLADQPCPCGAASTSRLHVFWLCPVASAVVEALRVQLTSFYGVTSTTSAGPPPGPSPVLQRRHVWLTAAPTGVQFQVWLMVCLAAIKAMDVGRRQLRALMLGPAPPTAPPASSELEGVAHPAEPPSSSPSTPRLLQRSLPQLWGVRPGPPPAGGPGPPQPSGPGPPPPPAPSAAPLAPPAAAAARAVAAFWEALVDMTALGVVADSGVGIQHPFLCASTVDGFLHVNRV
jgi:hypothetical protein